MGRSISAVFVTCLLVVGGVGCDSQSSSPLTVERLPDVNPNLPAVPQIPPPPHPVQYGDGSYSVFGLRKKMSATIDNSVDVTGYIVEIYQPPECPKDERCDAKAPHTWLADTANETDPSKRLMIVGYAENQEQVDEAIAKAKKGRYEPPPVESGILPIPTDFAVGNKVKVSGQFTHMSGSGFMAADGVLEYRGHQTLQGSGS